MRLSTTTPWRVAALVLAGLVLMCAAGVGVFAALSHTRAGSPTLALEDPADAGQTDSSQMDGNRTDGPPVHSSAESGAARATDAGDPQVIDALRRALAETGLPVRQITLTEDESLGPLTYLAVLAEAPGTSNAVNAELALQQATALAANGLPIKALSVNVVDGSGQGCFGTGATLEPDSLDLGATPPQSAVTQTEAALSAAVDETLASGAGTVGIQRGSVAIDQIGNGLLLARVGYQVADAASAKTAADASLVPRTAVCGRTAASATGICVSGIRVTMTDAGGTLLLDYWQNLKTGSEAQYCLPGTGIGDWWKASHPGAKVRTGDQAASQ